MKKRERIKINFYLELADVINKSININSYLFTQIDDSLSSELWDNVGSIRGIIRTEIHKKVTR